MKNATDQLTFSCHLRCRSYTFRMAEERTCAVDTCSWTKAQFSLALSMFSLQTSTCYFCYVQKRSWSVTFPERCWVTHRINARLLSNIVSVVRVSCRYCFSSFKAENNGQERLILPRSTWHRAERKQSAERTKHELDERN